MSYFQYFAYGSNMLVERLRARCPSAEPLFSATACGHELTFEKKSNDTSGKATLKASGLETDMVHGVVFRVLAAELDHLDEAEGHPGHYARKPAFHVRRVDTGGIMTVTTYIAQPNRIVTGLSPYDWYLSLIIAGARQHSLPDHYISTLESVAAVVDDVDDRPSRKHALDVLEKANVPTV